MSSDNLRETDRQYLKFKMKQIKEAKQKGNDAKARRLAVELQQYFGIGAEIPFVPEKFDE